MLFIKADNLKSGMRLAKPIYNKNGVMLYERNSELTSQGIMSIQNFGLIGVYILEPAEPLPPMSEDDIEFERFQAMSVFTIRDILDAVSNDKEPKDMYQFANEILKKYGSLHRKINFIQNLRSAEDYVYKHSLNTAILAALISNRLKIEFKRQLDIVVSALLHDVGGLKVSPAIRRKKKEELTEEDNKKINANHLEAYRKYKSDYDLDPDIRRILSMAIKEFHPDIFENSDSSSKTGKIPGVEILKVAYVFDNMTAMKFEEDPLSEIAAVRYLLDNKEEFDPKVVDALLQSINILQPGVCVELTDGDKGLVVTANDTYVLEPFVLSFRENKLINLGDNIVSRNIQIKDVMKTMDNRHVVDKDLLAKYTGDTVHMGEHRDNKDY